MPTGRSRTEPAASTPDPNATADQDATKATTPVEAQGDGTGDDVAANDPTEQDVTTQPSEPAQSTGVATATSPTVLDPTRGVAPSGWEVGNRAPEARYAPLGIDGEADYSQLQADPVEGYGVQVVAKGDVINQATYDLINQQESKTVLVQTPVAEPQGAGQRAASTS